MAFDALVTNPGRLRILTALAAEGASEFVRLRQRTCLTDGNLSAHARRLESAGLISIEKRFRAGKSVTHLRLTGDGRRALERHAHALLAVIGGGDEGGGPMGGSDSPAAATASRGGDDDPADDWVD